MMRLKTGGTLNLIVEHGTRILTYCEGQDETSFLAATLVQDGVAMNLIAIGQWMTDIREDDPSTFSEITGGSDVIGLRHRLAHDYEEIRFDLVWTFVEDHLPLLVQEATVLRDRYVDEYKIQID